jgi:predicted aspartyl protease
MRVRKTLFSALLSVVCCGGTALAADCGPLKQVNTVDLVPGPNRELVPVSINGTERLFLLDTGGDVSQISSAAADELKLAQRDSNIKLLDLYGNASSKAARIDQFGVGQLKGRDIYVAIQPNPDFGKGTRYVGLFSPDLMGRYDVEFDFGAQKMNYFSSDHCEGHVVYWKAPALAIVPMRFHNRHIRLPVTLEGHEFIAEFDTGASFTSITADTARRVLGVDAQTPGNVAVNNGMPGAFGHVFETLDFEGVAVKNPHVIVRPDLVGSKDADNGFQTGTRTKRVDDQDDRIDLIVGMDILKRLRMYIAFDERKIYISPATGPTMQAPAAGAVADVATKPQ